VIQYGPSIAKPVVRGLHSARIQVMNGTVPQEGQQWGAEHAPEIDGFQAHEVEIVRGAAGILYGSNAIGGVVRVLPRPLPTAHGLSGELQLNAFSNNRQGAVSVELEDAGLDLPWLADVSWRVQGTLRGAGDAATPTYYLPNTGFTEANWNVAAGIHRGWGTSQLSFSRFATHLGMYRGAHVGTVADLERAMQDPLTTASFARTIARPDQRVSHNLLTWENRLLLGDATALELTYGYQYNNRNEYDSKGFAADSPRPAFGLRLITHSVEARLQHALSPRVHGTVGVVGLRQGNLSRGRSFLIPQYRLYSGGVYALEQYDHGPLSLTAGLRYDARTQHVYQYGAPVVISPDEVHDWGGLSASAGVAWSWHTWTLATSVGRMWRPANVNERFSQGVHHGTAQYEIGDPSLDRERSVAVDATLRHQSDRLRFELTAYRNTIDGFMYLRPRAPVQTVRGAYPAYQYSGTDAMLTGGEASLQYEPTASLMFYASGTLVRGTDRLAGGPLFDMPADRLVASVRLHGTGTGRIEAPYVELGTTLVRRQDRIPAATVYPLPARGYALVNVEVGAGRLHLAGREIEAGLTVRNLFDTAYRDYLSRYRLYVDDQGRDVVLRLRATWGARQP
jgi:iron complex outermembrane receptor protein